MGDGATATVRVAATFDAAHDYDTLLLPARNITSCCLGGADLRTLFVTSGRAADDSEPKGGALFATEVMVPGLPEPVLRLS